MKGRRREPEWMEREVTCNRGPTEQWSAQWGAWACVTGQRCPVIGQKWPSFYTPALGEGGALSKVPMLAEEASVGR